MGSIGSVDRYSVTGSSGAGSGSGREMGFVGGYCE